MKKYYIRLIGVIAGFVLWGFFFLQAELASYGLYSLVSYDVQEISYIIPGIVMIATMIWIVVIGVKMSAKADKNDKWFVILFVLLLICQWGYFYGKKYEQRVTEIVTVENIDNTHGKMTLKKQEREEKRPAEIVVDAPDIIMNLAEDNGREYLASYEIDLRRPGRGRLYSLMIFKEN